MEPSSAHLGCVWLWDCAGTIPLGEASVLVVPCQEVQKLLFGFSCRLLESETSLLPKCLSHVPACPLAYKNIFVTKIVGLAWFWNGKTSGQAMPVAVTL